MMLLSTIPVRTILKETLQVEFGLTVETLLEKQVVLHPDSWDMLVFQTARLHNSSPKTGLSPAAVLFGRFSNGSAKTPPADIVQHYEAHKNLHEALIQSRVSEEQVEPSALLTPGTLVFIQSFPKHKRPNLRPRNFGPFVLIKSGRLGGCVVRLPNGTLRKTNIRQIRSTNLKMHIDSCALPENIEQFDFEQDDAMNWKFSDLQVHDSSQADQDAFDPEDDSGAESEVDDFEGDDGDLPPNTLLRPVRTRRAPDRLSFSIQSLL
eukprot:TRINITY_DN3168_c0_g1_i5.p1 TRINITY_DN3168_c0_g1~~TRINITY_DN3168_c0_g1_i5.p1  ORF type:complete len:264 (-),score=62.69 TRINITY_DN3168_c0_g1_i5:311-1102(-)